MAGSEELTCAYCLNEGSVMADPRTLPCRHMFCFTCLEDALPTQTITGIFKCPVCRVDHPLAGHADLAHLPTAEILREVIELPPSEESVHSSIQSTPENCCDGCMHKDLKRAALMFCIQCNIKMCAAHNESHDHLWGIGKHSIITFEDFQQQRDKLAARFCPAHNKQSLDFICVKCQQLLCVTCWSDAAADCFNGEVHQVKPLEGVTRQLKKKLSEAVEPVILLQRKLDKTLIQSDESCSAANSKFDNLIKDLHNARDLQLQEITAAYSHLEDRINQHREGMLNQYKAYAEKLHAQIVRLQTASKEADEMLANRNNVDVVLRAERLIQSMAAECRCKLLLPAINYMELIPIRHSRLAEVDLLLLPAHPDDEPRADIPDVIFDRRIDSGKWYQTVCHTDQGYMVAGVRDDGFDYLDSVGTVICTVKLAGNSIATQDSVDLVTEYSCCASKYRVYTLHYEFNYNYRDEGNIFNLWIGSYTLEGQLRYRWRASDSACGLAVVGDRMYVIDGTTKCVDVHSTRGHLLYTFSHPSFMAPHRVHAADHQSIIVCDIAAHLVTKFSVWDNTVVWQYAGLENPKGAAVDKHGRIWVATERGIHILSSEGILVFRLDIPEAVYVEDISIHEDQLVLIDSRGLLLYKIISQ